MKKTEECINEEIILVILYKSTLSLRGPSSTVFKFNIRLTIARKDKQTNY